MTSQLPAHLMVRSVKEKWRQQIVHALICHPRREHARQASNTMPFFFHRTCHAASFAGRRDVKSAPILFRWGAEFLPGAATCKSAIPADEKATVMLPYVRHSVFIPYLTLPPGGPGDMPFCAATINQTDP